MNVKVADKKNSRLKIKNKINLKKTIMKAKRLFFLVMAIFLASEVKAQFYDGPDDIYFYVRTDNPDHILKDVKVFNFDGEKACHWGYGTIKQVKDILKDNPNYFEDMIETTEYEVKYLSSYPQTQYQHNYGAIYIFSSDRKYCTHEYKSKVVGKYERVGKSFFRVGRSRTPSGTMYE